MSTETQKQEGLFYSIIDGTFRRRVPEGTQGATRREYETKDGTKGVKYEMVIDSLEGYVHGMTLNEGDFGRTLNIKLDPNEKGINPNLQFNVETAYGEDVLKKLPNVDFTKPVRFRPFAFTDQNTGREIRGVELKQGEEKLSNFFWDSENKKALNGLPEINVDPVTMTKDDWKIHFMTVRKFLIGYFIDTTLSKFESTPVTKVTTTPAAHPDLPGYTESETVDDDISSPF